MKRARCPTDLTDAQWVVVEAAMPRSKGGDKPADYPRREMWDAIFYHAKNGGSWRALPHDFPQTRAALFAHDSRRVHAGKL